MFKTIYTNIQELHLHAIVISDRFNLKSITKTLSQRRIFFSVFKTLIKRFQMLAEYKTHCHRRQGACNANIKAVSVARTPYDGPEEGMCSE